MASWEVDALSVVMQAHTINPLDPSSVNAKVRRINRHKAYDFVYNVKPPDHVLPPFTLLPIL